jgi:hypothetical protein
MKTKFVYNSGLAFSEEKEMKKLSKYARKGWLLESFAGFGFGYKLREGKPKNIDYSLDYQNGADEDYFEFFEAAG